MLILETSWEVCNKMGGIYTVLSSRARVMMQEHNGKVVFIGPYIKKNKPKDFISKTPNILKGLDNNLKALGLDFIIGQWDVPSKPPVILVDYTPLMQNKGEFYFEIWQKYSLESDKGYGDYDDSCIFSIAASMVMKIISDNIKSRKTIAIFNEWQTAMGLLYTKLHYPKIYTMFITHATTVGRSIAGNGKELYKYMSGYNGDQMSRELNVEAKHFVEKLAAHNANIFATVSELTAKECIQLIEKTPVVLPNGFEADLVPKASKYTKARNTARTKLEQIALALTGCRPSVNDLFIVISGRYEYRNKGIDLFVNAMKELREKLTGRKKCVYAFITVPAWVSEYREDLKYILDNNILCDFPLQNSNLTHWLHNMNEDRLINHLKFLGLNNSPDDNVKVIFAPCYLNGDDGIFNLKYYDLLPGFDLSLFPSYYEPWGYTPLESIAFGVPTITSNFAGFGLWAREVIKDRKYSGVEVIERSDDMIEKNAYELASMIVEYLNMNSDERSKHRRDAKEIAKKAEWEKFYKYYIEAMSIVK